MIPWLPPESPADTPFPPLGRALRYPDGLLCAGGDLSPARLLNAYRHGIFPWYSPGEPILWWSPDPRMALLPAEIKISRSLRKTLRQQACEIRLDHDFAAVVAACGDTPREGQNGTWIVPEMRAAYGELHRLGYAHSVETWHDGQLVGGLYGVAIGRMFYGESMFSWRTDASKIAVAHLARFLESRAFGVIDCQMHTPHLASLGARLLPREDFLARLTALTAQPDDAGPWPCALRYEWN